MDPTFASNGLFESGLGTGYACGMSVALQPDGKLIMAGFSHAGNGMDWSVIRLLPTGAFDADFSGDGVATSNWADADDKALNVAVRTDGKIVLGGTYYANGVGLPMVARLMTDGSMDPTFGTDGVALTPFSGGTYVSYSDMELLPDGKILVACDIAAPAVLVFRMNIDGSLDTAFAHHGEALLPLPDVSNAGPELSVAPDGGIIVLSRSAAPLFSDHMFGVLKRLDVDGNLDSSFGNAGMTVIDASTEAEDEFHIDVEVDAANRILIAGWTDAQPTRKFIVTRLDASGTLDPSFGTNGSALLPEEPDSYGQLKDMLILNDGSIMLTGISRGGQDAYPNIVMMKLLPNGSLDLSFGANGRYWPSVDHQLIGMSLGQ